MELQLPAPLPMEPVVGRELEAATRAALQRWGEVDCWKSDGGRSLLDGWAMRKSASATRVAAAAALSRHRRIQRHLPFWLLVQSCPNAMAPSGLCGMGQTILQGPRGMARPQICGLFLWGGTAGRKKARPTCSPTRKGNRLG
uniref:Uncharacterized protein n=1 Tax=Oryza sativa subsp. japonica TaxID=39947 RepID=Q6Z466_ORYSJ|nr:hypothetical protein [Oryza sativa Japonica Group]